MNKEFGIKLKGMVKIMVLDKGIIVKDFPWQQNMILNQGKNNFMNGTASLARMSNYCAAGSGTTAVSATDVGLVSEIKRSTGYLTGTGNCGTTAVGQTLTFRRTYEFAAETGSVDYRELGFSNTSSSGNNLFSRVLISGGTVSLVAGQSLRVIYDLAVTLTPTGIISGSVSLSGWPVSPATNTNATWAIGGYPIGTVDTSGLGSQTQFDPSYGSVQCYCRTGVITLNPFGTNASGGSTITNSLVSGSWDTYTPGSFSRTVSFPYLSASSFASTAISSFFYGNDQFCIKWDQNQTKANTHRLRYNGITLTIA